jgi:hypothetical protein
MREHLGEGSPVISVDTKKKEPAGDFRNGGLELQPKASPQEVRIHDFVDPELGRAVPYGVYDIANKAAWVSVGVDHNTAAFAVNTIRRWWHTMGKARYPKARRPMITADGGGQCSQAATCRPAPANGTGSSIAQGIIDVAES